MVKRITKFEYKDQASNFCLKINNNLILIYKFKLDPRQNKHRFIAYNHKNTSMFIQCSKKEKFKTNLVNEPVRKTLLPP